MSLREGQVWLANLEPVVANEQGGVRPCLVVSNDTYHRMPIDHACIVPLTTRDRGLLHHLPLDGEGGLDRPSFAMTEAIKTVSTVRFIRQLGEVSPATVATIRSYVGRFLGG
jgi:mRNA interferase MazF